MSDLYDADILLWSEHQAELLRRLAAGERLNERPDWVNLIDEVESVGRSKFGAVKGLLVQSLAHWLKSQAWPDSREVPGWLAEYRGFKDDAKSRFSPCMRQRLDLGKIYRRAMARVPAAIDGVRPLASPATCPFTLDELLQDS